MLYCQVASKGAMTFGQLSLYQIAFCQISYDCLTVYSFWTDDTLLRSLKGDATFWSNGTLPNDNLSK
jgi:hypothetical protein